AAIVVGDAGRQELQGDRLVERQVVRAIHFSHAAAAEQRDKAVASGDNRAWREGSRWLRPGGDALAGAVVTAIRASSAAPIVTSSGRVGTGRSYLEGSGYDTQTD